MRELRDIHEEVIAVIMPLVKLIFPWMFVRFNSGSVTSHQRGIIRV